MENIIVANRAFSVHGCCLYCLNRPVQIEQSVSYVSARHSRYFLFLSVNFLVLFIQRNESILVNNYLLIIIYECILKEE